MSNSLDSAYTSPPRICCCRPKKDTPEGYIYINAGCKIHGLGVDIAFYANRTLRSSNEMRVPNHPTRAGGSRWHHISEGG